MTLDMPDAPHAAPRDQATLDHILTAQLIVAWAGESGDPPRLGWWRSDLTSEFGGEDLFRRLLPHTWPWATLQAAREVARNHDTKLRQQTSHADHVITLFALGWELDEHLDERLAELKREATPPKQALSGLALVLDATDDESDVQRFERWITGHGSSKTTVTPAGRRIAGDPPGDPIVLTDHLIAALAPLGSSYPMPHFVRRA